MCGSYALQGRTLVKLKGLGDVYGDMTWHAGGGKWTLRGGQFNGWTLKRPDTWPAKPAAP